VERGTVKVNKATLPSWDAGTRPAGARRGSNRQRGRAVNVTFFTGSHTSITERDLGAAQRETVARENFGLADSDAVHKNPVLGIQVPHHQHPTLLEKFAVRMADPRVGKPHVVLLVPAKDDGQARQKTPRLAGVVIENNQLQGQ
jgi:hypothetical protein